MTITFQTLPVSTNNMYAHVGRRRFLTPKARANKEAIAWEARSQYRDKPLEGPLAVSVRFYWPTRRNHDIENAKGLFDALTGILWLDDGQIQELHSFKYYDKERPRVELTIDAAASRQQRRSLGS